MTKINDKEYWNRYYQNNNNTNNLPSDFAKFLVLEGYITDQTKLIDLGCGNGRDTVFFSKMTQRVTAVDQCNYTTSHLNQLDGLTAYGADFTNLEDQKSSMLFDLVYSRFTMHAVDEIGEKRTLDWAYKNLSPGGFFCIEVRTTKDPLFGLGIDKGNNTWFYNNHHRRFIDAMEFKIKMENAGFNVQLYKEASGFAKYKTEDPIILRIIGSK